MFIEPRRYNIHTGWIEVICGSMFSGKTEELLRRLKRAKFANQRVEIFKPLIDTRYHDTLIVSHDSNHIQSNPVGVAENILLYANEVDLENEPRSREKKFSLGDGLRISFSSCGDLGLDEGSPYA